MPSELEHVSGLPLGSFRSEHVAQQVQRACRREQVSMPAVRGGKQAKKSE
jgi:hypothetical protein